MGVGWNHGACPPTIGWRTVRGLTRDLPAYLAIVLLMTMFGGLVWLTRDPDNPFFDRFEGWRWIGPRIAALRGRYLEPERSPAAGGGGEVDAGAAEDEGEAERTYVGVGISVRAAPKSSAPLLFMTERLNDYRVRSRKGSWIEIELADGGSAWFDPDAPRAKEPPLGSDPLPPTPLPAAKPSPERLAEVKALMRADRVIERPLGGYTLLTDVSRNGVIEPFSNRLEQIEAIYARRYGVVPLGEPAETIVLFADEASYRQLESTIPELRGSGSAGHASRGLVATFAGERPVREITATVVHEIGHLLSRRALGPALPDWLGEGLADELAWMAVPEAEGASIYEGLRRTAETDAGVTIYYSGPLAGLRSLVQRARKGRLPPLELLVAPSFPASSAISGEELYSYSSFFVHYLLERRQPRRWDQGFRAFLADVAAGEAPSSQNLLSRLDTDWPTLDLDFRAWLLLEGAEAGVAEVEPEQAPPQDLESGD